MKKRLIGNIIAGSLGFIGVISILKGNKIPPLLLIMFFSFYSNITWDHVKYELINYK